MGADLEHCVTVRIDHLVMLSLAYFRTEAECNRDSYDAVVRVSEKALSIQRRWSANHLK
jgi:hypothetical protein